MNIGDTSANADSRHDDSQLRIAMMLPNLEIGGSQEVVRSLALNFANDGCTPIVCALFRGGELERDLAKQGTEYEVLNLSRRPMRKLPLYASDMWRLSRRLKQFFTNYRINVIQTNNLGTQDFIVLAVARRLKIPVVTFNFHDERIFPADRNNHFLTRIQRPLYRTCRRWANDYVAVSPETKAALVKQLNVADDQVTTICNAVDVRTYERDIDRHRVRRDLGVEPDSKLLLTVATLKEQKGHCYLIEAAKEIVEQEPRAHFLFAGDGVLREELQQRASSLGLSANIHFLGSRRDVLDLLLASDAFVLPSLFEGLSMALLEAMAARIPVVATAVSGTTTVVNSPQIAMLVPPKDPASLAGAILDLFAKPPSELQTQCAAAYQRIIDEFSLDHQANQYLDLYRRHLTACQPAN